MPPPAPLSVGQRVLDTVRDQLLSGRYAPGERLSIHGLAIELGVSKQPVLDAMRRLETTGLVKIVPQSGCRVVDYRPEEVRHFFEVFAAAEAEVAAAAAAHRTDGGMVTLRAQWQRMEELAGDEGRGLRAYQDLNRAFHSGIHAMARSRLVALVSSQMWDLSDFFMGTVGGSVRTVEAAGRRNDEHRLILEAIDASDVDMARVLMRAHVHSAVGVVGHDPVVSDAVGVVVDDPASR